MFVWASEPLPYLLFSHQWANDRWCLTSVGPPHSLPNTILLLSNGGGEKKEKMFQCLCLTGKINCTYKIQITLFNLKMIGPGPSPKAWSVGWCMALVYFSTANPALHSFLQTSRAELEGDECEQCDGARWRLMFNKPLSLHSTLIWKYEAARVEREDY